MIGPTGAVRVLVATKPVDFRKGAEGLAALVREVIDFLATFRTVSEETIVTTEEKMVFKLPRQLTDTP